MKIIMSTAALALSTVALVGSLSFGAYAAMPGAMKGVDATYKSGAAGKTCSGAAQLCKKNLPASAAACTSAGASCMQTGVFTNPQGRSFPGMAKK
jgi:hypothetical protein